MCVCLGGHTSEILRLMESLSAAYTPRHYVIADTDTMSEEKIVTFESSKKLSDSESQQVHVSRVCVCVSGYGRGLSQSFLTPVYPACNRQVVTTKTASSHCKCSQCYCSGESAVCVGLSSRRC